MKTSSFLWMGLIGFMVLSSCEDERIISQSTTVNAITVSGEDFTDGETGTRAGYLVDGTGFHFSWTQGDTVGIYPLGGDQVAFPISSGEGSQTAQFDGGAWALRSTYSYAAYYPFSSDNYKNKETSIPVSYLDQVQNGNGSLDCLDRYDYQASIATKPDANGNVNIALKHLGCFVRFQLTMPVADTYSSIELKSTGTPFITSGYVDLSSDSIHITPTTTSQTIKIDLNNTSTTAQDSVLVVYAMLAPTDLSGKNINVIVTGSDDNKYVSFFTGKNMLAGKAYSYKSGLTDGATVTEDGDIVPPDNEIWYITNDNTIIDLEASYSLYNSQPFDADVISHTYENGMGVIKCDGPIKIIYDHVFGNGYYRNITSIYLPNSIEELKTGALDGTGVEELRIPDNLKCVDSYALTSNLFKRFYGKHTYEDGRCVIIEDGFMPDHGNIRTPVKNYMAAFAPSGIKEFTVPTGVETIGWYVFAWCPELKVIHFNEGLKAIMGECFLGDVLDCDIILPSTLENLDSYAFHDCSGITGFYGNDNFHTEDHLCLTFNQTVFLNPEMNGKWISKFVGDNLSHYTIPDGIVGIENYAFDNLKNLTSVTVPSSVKRIGNVAFNMCNSLQTLLGPYASEDNRSIVIDNRLCMIASNGIKEYVTPNNVNFISGWVLHGLKDVERIVISDTVERITDNYAFYECYNLKEIVLSANLLELGYDPFGSPLLKQVFCRSMVPPVINSMWTTMDSVTIYVPSQSVDLYKQAPFWKNVSNKIVAFDYTDLPETDFYISSDFSHNGQVNTIQNATSGDGIDLVFMGDAYSDRQIADGTYAGVMQDAMNAFFAEEPYKSFKDYFNVYSVNVISLTEGYEHSGQALGTGHGDATYVYGNDAKVIEYAKKAISEDKLDDAVIIVMMNEDAYAGTCYMYDPVDGDYGRGTAIAYFPTNSITENFNGLVLHEAGGHGFAKLADEYAYEYNGAITQEAIDANKVNEPYGWWKNVDFTSDPTKVKWSTFISDSRYTNENIGCYEGGLTYWSGVWRPTEESIMRYNTGGFNAPSRYAIWYRINKLAFGDSWNGTYEDFVEYDAINRTPSAVARRTQSRRNYVEKPLPALAPPVVVGHSWREAK